MSLTAGSGTNVSVKELADIISPDQTHLPRRAGDAEITLADVNEYARSSAGARRSRSRTACAS